MLAHKKEVMKKFNEEIMCKAVNNKKNQQGILKHPRASSKSERTWREKGYLNLGDL